MRIFYGIRDLINEKNGSTQDAVAVVITGMREQKRVISGFGHRLHKEDPRTKRLFGLAREYGIAGSYIRIARSVESKLKELTGKHLPVNVDGAIAAVLCELGFPASFGNLFFILSRIPGLSAHIHEEQTRYKPMRQIDPLAWEYDGPAERSL